MGLPVSFLCVCNIIFTFLNISILSIYRLFHGWSQGNFHCKNLVLFILQGNFVFVEKRGNSLFQHSSSYGIRNCVIMKCKIYKIQKLKKEGAPSFSSSTVVKASSSSTALAASET